MPNDNTEGEKKQEKSKGQIKKDLLQVFLDGCNLWQNESAEPYCDVKLGANVKSLPFKSALLRAWIIHTLHQNYSSIPEKDMVNAIHDLLEAKARLFGVKYQTYARVCRKGQEIFVDLGAGKMVHVTPNGWQVEDRRGIKFIESGNMIEQVHPREGGNIMLLRKYLNVSDDDFKLLVFWLVGSYASSDSYAQLILNGPMDSGKSTTTELIRSLIDPAPRPTDSPPKDEGDVAALAKNNFVVAVDNLSYIPPWLSDSLCRVATGGGVGKQRKLYTDNESASFKALRPVILNGIPQFVEKSDLMSRCLMVPLQSVDVSKRSEWYNGVKNVFPNEKGLILGALMGALVVALRGEQDAFMDEMPRLISFSKCCIAAEEYFGWKGEFERLWNANAELKSVEFVSANGLAQAIFAYFEQKKMNRQSLTLKGRLTEIKSELIMASDSELPKSDKDFALKLQALRQDLLRRGVYMPPKLRNKGGTIYELTVTDEKKLFL